MYFPSIVVYLGVFIVVYWCEYPGRGGWCTTGLILNWSGVVGGWLGHFLGWVGVKLGLGGGGVTGKIGRAGR